MTIPLLLEIIGYIGTALVIISMLMTSVVRLRVLNLCGAAVSLVYALAVAAWPVALLNLTLTAVNAVQLWRLRRRHTNERSSES